ncbi:hypothetical protein Y032_0079g1258 [Ancylostoma ceylanicum]|nr:hypothetical protein Y032_0079g1258 [Ancylostoma ceylanicum]
MSREQMTSTNSSLSTIPLPTKLVTTTTTKFNGTSDIEAKRPTTEMSGYDTVDTFSSRQWPTSTTIGEQPWFAPNSTEKYSSTLIPSKGYSWRSDPTSSSHWHRSISSSLTTLDPLFSTSQLIPGKMSSSKQGSTSTAMTLSSEQQIYSTKEKEMYPGLDSSLMTQEIYISTPAQSRNEQTSVGTISRANGGRRNTTVTQSITDHIDMITSLPEKCRRPCPSSYEEGPDYCYRILTAKESSTYKRALKNCQDESDSDLADEIDLRNPEVIQLVRLASNSWWTTQSTQLFRSSTVNISHSQLFSPVATLFYVNEHDSKTIAETQTIRVISMKRTTRFFLYVNTTARVNEHFTDVHGVCKRTKYCASMQCSLDDFVFYGMNAALVLPEIDPKMDIGQKLNVPCAKSNNTKMIEVTCNERGRLQPHPTTINCTLDGSNDTKPDELETEWNRKVLNSCDGCHRLGTSSCNPVHGGFECRCKPNWSGYICWKSPDQCELNRVDCGNNGACISEVDQAYCSCDEGYGGDRCEVLKSSLSLNSQNKSSIVSAATGSALIMTANEIILMILKGILLLYRPKSGEDTQIFYQNMRSLTLSAAGFLVLFFHHPALFVISSFDCSVWFYMITTGYSLAIGFFSLEALNMYEVSHTEQRNTWCDTMEETDFEQPKLALRTLLTIFALGSGVAAVTTAHFGRVATSWTCLGNFAEETTDLWLPLVLINACVALAATSFSYYGWFILRNVPQYRQKMNIYLAGRTLYEKCCIDKCYRNVAFTAFGPWLLFATWLTLAMSSDWVADSVLNK